MIQEFQDKILSAEAEPAHHEQLVEAVGDLKVALKQHLQNIKKELKARKEERDSK
jgi:hypothetical protein